MIRAISSNGQEQEYSADALSRLAYIQLSTKQFITSLPDLRVRIYSASEDIVLESSGIEGAYGESEFERLFEGAETKYFAQILVNDFTEKVMNFLDGSLPSQ